MPSKEHKSRYKYKDKYCKEIIDLSAQGLHFIQIAARWGIAEETLNAWAREIPAFAEAKAIAKTAAKARYMQELDRAAEDGDFQINRVPALIFKGKACYGLRDKDPNVTTIKAETPQGNAVFNFETVKDSDYTPPEVNND